MSTDNNGIVHLSSRGFMAGCLALAAGIVVFFGATPIPSWVIALEVMVTILALFVFGSIRYQLDKNALTYGAVMVIAATFWTSWWPASSLRAEWAAEGMGAAWPFISHHLLTLHGLDELFHADTMLFILGLTFFVAVIAQTRLLETLSFQVLARNKGNVLPTVAILTAVVAFSSGILDGVSMIGLMIRTLVIILFLAKADDEAVIFSVIIATVVTTVCGMWLAYGEPPNLIMKSNLTPHLDDAFFLRYCAPVAAGSWVIVYWNLRKRLKGRRVDVVALDVLDKHTADVRFLQAARHGEVLTPVEFAEAHERELGFRTAPILRRLHAGEPLGAALVHEEVPEATRRTLMGKFVSEELADALDRHYVAVKNGPGAHLDEAGRLLNNALIAVGRGRRKSQVIGILSFLPFVALLVAHAVNHAVPLFLASGAGFLVALGAVSAYPRMRRLALADAAHEYREYLFLFPLFLSITLLQKSGFFVVLSEALHSGIETLGVQAMALIQYAGALVLSAMLDNNVVADFAARAIKGLEIGMLHLFSMAQIAGYAAGGCWTHIGSAQSVVAFAFIHKEVDAGFSPIRWIKAMTPIIIQISILMAAVIFIESHFVG